MTLIYGSLRSFTQYTTFSRAEGGGKIKEYSRDNLEKSWWNESFI